jgi:hypothetical protein
MVGLLYFVGVGSNVEEVKILGKMVLDDKKRRGTRYRAPC